MEKIGTYVWIKDKTESYIPYYIQGNTGDNFQMQNFENKETRTLASKEINGGVPANESTLNENFENLIYLPEFSDASILYQLRSKYKKDKIYTYIGEILISVNPFKTIPFEIKDFVAPIASLEDIDPNVYSIANNLYWKLMGENKSKSVIISGESGSGKTEVNKMILNLITLIDKSGDDLKTVILKSNPILEAFGNAKTGRNENSSRFGKWQELYISDNKQLSGFSIVNYLLEKSRIIAPGKGERNYHIFYSLFNSSLASQYKLTDPNDFKILSCGKTIESTGWDDQTCNNECTVAFKSFGFEDEEITSIWKALVAILNLGNIEFGLNVEEESSYIQNKEVIEVVAECLGTTVEDTEEAITCRIVSILNERTKCPLLPENAQKNTDTLCKTIYSVLFDYLVYRINEKGNKPSNDDAVFFGTLDIFGFEVFKKNSLEQFCINWTNEKLQHNFNKFIVDYEKSEFDKEGISIGEITFVSNKECINLIEGKGSSIISAVNDESTVPQGNDKQLLGKLKDTFSGNKYFSKSLNDTFIIKHYAESVEYTIDGFVYKNTDKIPESFTVLLEASTVPLIQKMFSEKKGGEFVKTHDLKDNSKKRPILHKFKRNLTKLIDRINDTDPYFIKCIKPNDQKSPDTFSSPKVLEQLRCAGLNELLRLRKSNFPHRFKFSDFVGRFYLILQNYTFNKNTPNEELKDDVMNIIQNITSKGYKIGITKIMCKDEHLSELNAIKEEKMKVYLQAIIAYCKCISAKLIAEKSLSIYKSIKDSIATENYARMQEIVKDAQTSNINFFKLTVANKLLKVNNAINEEDYGSLEEEINNIDNENLKKELGPLKLTVKAKGILELKSIIEEYNNAAQTNNEINIELLNQIKSKQETLVQTLTPLITENNTIITFSGFITKCIGYYEGGNIDSIIKEVDSLDSSIKQQYEGHLIYKISNALVSIYNAFTAKMEDSFEGVETYMESLNATLMDNKLEVIEKFPIFVNSNILIKIFADISDNKIDDLNKELSEYNEIKTNCPQAALIKEEIIMMANYVVQINDKIKESKDKEEVEKIKNELLEKKFKINSVLIERINSRVIEIENLNVVVPEIPILRPSVESKEELPPTPTPTPTLKVVSDNIEKHDENKLEITSDKDLEIKEMARASSVLKLPIKETDSTVSTDTSEDDDIELDPELKESFDRRAAEKARAPTPTKVQPKPKSKKEKKSDEKEQKIEENKPTEEFIFPIFKGIKADEIFEYDFPGYIDFSDSVEKLANSFQFQTCRLLRLPENYSKKHSLQFLGFNAEVAHSFLFYSPTQIPRSLVKFNAAYVGDKHTAKAVKLEAPKLFGMLLQAEKMFVNSLDIISSAKLTNFNLKSSKDPRFTSFYNSIKNILKMIIQLCRNQPLLHDEIFCQLIKQTTKNSSPSSMFFYWALMLSVVTAIRPSAQLSSFLAAHCVRSFRSKGIIRYGTTAELATNVFTIMKEYKEGIREPDMPPFYLFKYTLFKDALYKISIDIHFAYLEEKKKPLQLSLNQVSGELVEDLMPRVFSYFITRDASAKKFYVAFTLKLKFSDEDNNHTETIKNLNSMFNLLVYKKIPIIDIIQFITKEVDDVKGLGFKLVFVRYRTVPEDLEIEAMAFKSPWELLRYQYNSLKYKYEKETVLNMNDKQIASIVMLSLVEKKKGKRLNSNDILHLDDDELLNLIPEYYRGRLEFHSWQSLIFKAATEIKFRKKIVLNQQDTMIEFIKIISKCPEYALNEYYVCFKNSSKFKVKTWYILAFNWYILVFKENDGTVIAKHLLKGISEVSYDKENHNLKFAIKEKEKTVVSLYCDIEVFNKLNTFRRYIPPSHIL